MWVLYCFNKKISESKFHQSIVTWSWPITEILKYVSIKRWIASNNLFYRALLLISLVSGGSIVTSEIEKVNIPPRRWWLAMTGWKPPFRAKLGSSNLPMQAKGVLILHPWLENHRQYHDVDSWYTSSPSHRSHSHYYSRNTLLPRCAVPKTSFATSEILAAICRRSSLSAIAPIDWSSLAAESTRKDGCDLSRHALSWSSLHVSSTLAGSTLARATPHLPPVQDDDTLSPIPDAGGFHRRYARHADSSSSSTFTIPRHACWSLRLKERVLTLSEWDNNMPSLLITLGK